MLAKCFELHNLTTKDFYDFRVLKWCQIVLEIEREWRKARSIAKGSEAFVENFL